jgi:oxygen-independent coproporphyrinogen III oxidase
VRVVEAGRPLVRVVAAAFDAYLGRGAGRHSRAV